MDYFTTNKTMAAVVLHVYKLQFIKTLLKYYMQSTRNNIASVHDTDVVLYADTVS